MENMEKIDDFAVIYGIAWMHYPHIYGIDSPRASFESGDSSSNLGGGATGSAKVPPAPFPSP
jgi:hypothetical protein